MTERELMLAVVEAARELSAHGGRSTKRLDWALIALDAHPPEPKADMVDVRQEVLWNTERREAICVDTASLNDYWPGYRHIATIFARVPLPSISEIPATVEGKP